MLAQEATRGEETCSQLDDWLSVNLATAEGREERPDGVEVERVDTLHAIVPQGTCRRQWTRRQGEAAL